jgi:prepilin-type N-terminal cleavage/methylation domain-containing protein
MPDYRSMMADRRSSAIDSPDRGFTLVEAVTVVFVLSILTCIAVPRLNFGAVWGARADAVVQRLATDLRHTRALAVTHAARNPDGFVLEMQGLDPYRSYQIIDQRDRTVMTACIFPAGVQVGGGRRFEFGPLGNLRNGSDVHLGIRTEGKYYRVEIAPATGAVEWYRDDNHK